MLGTKLKVGGGVLAGALISGGLAFAAIPDADGTIHACMSSYERPGTPRSPNPTRVGDGAVRIVEGSESCRSTETAISWNQEGSPGETGPAGPAGPSGLSNLCADPPSDGAARRAELRGSGTRQAGGA